MLNWVLMALGFLFLWGIINVLDNYFVEDVYKNEADGLILSGFFNILTVVFILAIFRPQFPDDLLRKEIFLSFLGGAALMICYIGYFKCLFSLNDSVLLQIIWIATTPVTMFLAWILLGDKLESDQYLGIALVFLGTALVGIREFKFKNGAKDYLVWAALMIVGQSLSEVSMKAAYDGDVSFLVCFVFLCLGESFVSLIILLAKLKRIRREGIFLPMAKKFLIVFAMVELLEVFAGLGTQKVIDSSEFVSLYAGLEACMPMMVVFAGLFFIVILKLPLKVLQAKSEVGEDIWKNIKYNLPKKIIATLVVAIGIFFIVYSS